MAALGLKRAKPLSPWETALKEFGRLHPLINNIGDGEAASADVDMEAWAKGLEIKKNEGQISGSVINMGSVALLKGGTPHLLYPTSKGAFVNMTRAVAAHHAPDGIRVNCGCSRMLYTTRMYTGGMIDEAREALRKRSLFGTEGSRWDAACAFMFHASNHSRWIIGAILPGDAGSTVGISMLKSASVNGRRIIRTPENPRGGRPQGFV